MQELRLGFSSAADWEGSVRLWRKLESSVVTSERLSKVSDSAKWLFALLVVAQDDEGKYPWTPTMVRSLTVGTSWDSQCCDSLLSELRESGVTTWREGFVSLTNGAEKNGTPANSKRFVMLYPPLSEPYGESLASQTSHSAESLTTVQSRVEKSRGEESTPLSPPKPKREKKPLRASPPGVSGEFRAKMREKYIFLNGRTVDERINEALNHKRVFKAVDVEQYVDGWLRRDQVYVQERSQPHDVSQPGPDKYQRELERQQRQAVAHRERLTHV